MPVGFFAGPIKALQQPLARLYGPSGHCYSVRHLDELDAHVFNLRHRQLVARARGNYRLAAQFAADYDALLERRAWLALISDATPEDVEG